MTSILIIEDDPTFSGMLKAWLSQKEYNVDTALTGSEARKKMLQQMPEVILCDLRLPQENGNDILEWIKKKSPETVVIMMTGYADIRSAVRAIKLGAYDYISKPFNPEEIYNKITEALKPKETPKVKKQKKQEEKDKTEPEDDKDYVRGQSEKWQRLYELIDLVAPTKLAVMILGESGVGKEYIARMIHDKSEDASKPFVAVDCGVLSKDLAASEFFGHVKGAFTGAINNKVGFFEHANGGTLFLDEIGNLSPDIQSQLLRALQEKRIKPVGSEKEIEVDVRIITATNEDIGTSVNAGLFRTDLFHRISEFILNVPSLKEVKEDIPLYITHFLNLSNKLLKKNVSNFTREAIEILTNYEWPGNIREMKNIINRLVLISTKNEITADEIPDYFKNSN